MSKVIIFGASGFVGKALTPLFKQQDVSFIPLSSKDLDLTDSGASKKIRDMVQDGDTIIMLAAYTPEKGDHRIINIKNLQMMNHLLMGIQNCEIEHFIHVSSDAVYPLTADIVDELTPISPYSLYGYMHAMHELSLKSFFQKQKGKLTIIRPCAIYGEGDSHNAYGINRFIRSALEQGEIVLFGGGEEYRDHIHVDDVAAIIFAASQKKMAGTFNAASGKSWRFSEITAFIQSGFDKKIAIVHKPRAMPVFHRHVDITTLRSAFPSLRPRTIDAGIRPLLKISVAA